MNSKLTMIASILFAAMGFAACSDSGSSGDESAALLAVAALASAPADLPQPTLDTANMTLGGNAFTLTNKLTCISGAGGLGFAMAGGGAPTLFVHNIDFSASSVSIGAGGSQLDIDVTGGVYGAASTCAGKIMENTATVYDLQVKDCALNTQFGTPSPTTTTVSFRARCTKG